ncbi:metallophosphoesterase [Parasutterella muris]|uniref:metallophosphoesterase n=1 Tax=Parasutterella muris TaxID=2565572 RepID=UPI00203A3E32|nr:metallophosphoesterase [Parasutterella muris]
MSELENFVQIYNNLKDFPKIIDVANHFHINERTVRKKAKKARDEGYVLINRAKQLLSEDISFFKAGYTKDDCIEELQKVQKENEEKFITRNFYRNHTQTSDSTWNRFFGTFEEFKRQAGLTLTRPQQQLEKDIAKHASRDAYKAFNEERQHYEGKYLKPNSNRFKTVLIASDLHDVECDKFFLRTFLDVAKRAQPDVICIGGDLFDLPEFGKYSVDPREWNVVNRIKFVHDEVLKPMRKVAPNSQIDLIEGNHECISLDTEVLTDKGWVLAPNLRLDMKVASFSQSEEKLHFENPIALKGLKLVQAVLVEGTLANECVSLSHNIFLDGKLQPVKQFERKGFRANRKKLVMNLEHKDSTPLSDVLAMIEGTKPVDFGAMMKVSAETLKELESHLSEKYFTLGRAYTMPSKEVAEALQIAYVLHGTPCVVKEMKKEWRINILERSLNAFCSVERADRQTVVAVQTVDGTLITKRGGVVNFTGNCRLIKHLAEATPALRAVLSDLHGFTISKLLGLDEYEVNYIAKADLRAWSKRDEEKELANNYKVYYDSFLVHHLPQARDMGMPGCHGHHHKHIVWSSFSPTYGTYEWHQLGCGHKRSASYCEGEKWGLGFGLVHIDTKTKATNFEYIPVTNFAIAGGKWYERDFATESPI